MVPTAYSHQVTPARTHIHALDGLRGIAVLMVMGLHFYPKWLIASEYPGLTPIVGRVVGPGAYGVQLFFVLSGFLITGILLETKGQPGFLAKFYARRTLRIFPLYYAALAAVFLVLPNFMQFDQGAIDISARQGWLWAYLGNWPTIWSWDDSALFNLNHFWSLCVEEHFYLVWPFAVLFTSPRGLLRLAFGLVGLSALFRAIAVVAGTQLHPIFIWPSLNTLDGLAVGAIIAIAVREPEYFRWLPTGQTYRRFLVALCVGSLAWVLLPRRIHHPILNVFGETLIVVFFGLILLGAIRLKAGETFHELLVSVPLVTFGKYSYGLYVIHGILRPAFERLFDFRHLPTSHGLSFLWMLLYYGLTISASLALAFLSYHGFEKWFLKLKRHFDYSAKTVA